MTPTQLLAVLTARRRTAAAVFAAVVAAAAVLMLLLPRHYTATAAMVLDVKSPDPIAGVVLPGMMTSAYMATQSDVLQSERVALHALSGLGLEQDDRQRRLWVKNTGGRGDFRAWLVERLVRGLDVRPARDSNVITVAYTSDDPQRAADTANAIVAAYIDTTRDLRTEPARQYNSFFDERSRQLREALEAAQHRLSAYQRDNGIVVTGEQVDLETSRLAELSSQVVTLQALTDESGARQRQASRGAGRMHEAQADPVVAALTTDLGRQEARLEEIGSRLGSANPQVQDLRANIATLRARIDAQTRGVSEAIASGNAVNQSRLAQARAAVEAQRSRILQLRSRHDEAAVLVRDVENARRSYDEMFTRVGQTRMESQNTQTNVAVLKNATPPAEPSSPRPSLTVGLALLLAAVLALGTAAACEHLDPRLRWETDVTDRLGQHFLGVLPGPAGAGSPGQSRLRLIGSPIADGRRRIPAFGDSR